jgi:hypothetical protein
MDQYFLVTGTLRTKEYEGRETERKVTSLVIAEDEKEAEEKFRFYFESKTQEYAVYYRVNGIEVHETIK